MSLELVAKNPKRKVVTEYTLPYIADLADEILILERWLNNRVHPGTYMWAVLSNNLKNTLCFITEHNYKNLPRLVAYIDIYVPDSAKGSEDIVSAWFHGELE